MQETLSRETLNQKDKEMLEKIIIKDASQMNSEEIAILRARRAYLTPIEEIALKEVLEVKEEEEETKEEVEEIGEVPEGTGKAPQIEEEIKEKKTLKKSKKKRHSKNLRKNNATTRS